MAHFDFECSRCHEPLAYDDFVPGVDLRSGQAVCELCRNKERHVAAETWLRTARLAREHEREEATK